jgi:hypothetical protein
LNRSWLPVLVLLAIALLLTSLSAQRRDHDGDADRPRHACVAARAKDRCIQLDSQHRAPGYSPEPVLPISEPMIRSAVLLVAVAVLLLTTDPCSAASARQSGSRMKATRSEPQETYDKWDWFKDTYWIVPEEGIYSVFHPLGTDEFVVAQGQTVFHLTDYFNGYFTGAVVVKLTGLLVPSCQYVLGQVTPKGQVYLTMYAVDGGAVTNNPIGTMVKKNGKWTMVNQMTGPTASGGTISHWAYMVQSAPGDATFESLPFAGESIPTFMSSCPAGPTITRP